MKDMMKRRVVLAVLAVMLVFVSASLIMDIPRSGDAVAQEPSKLLVVWTSGDKDVAMSMVYMYTLNAKKQGWFDEVRFLIWGPSSRLLAGDRELQEYLAKMKDAGVELQACIACANMYGVTEDLRKLGVDVRGMGRPFTDMLKSGWTTVTF